MKKKSKKKLSPVAPPLAVLQNPYYRAAPTNFKAVAEDGCITLTWDAQPDAVSYNVWRSLPGRKPVVIGATSETHYIDRDLVSGLVYTYSLHSCNEAGFSAQYTFASATPYVSDVTLTISLDKKRVVGGETFKLTLTLDQPAAKTGHGITLATDSEAVELPSQTILEAGKKIATIEVMTKEVTATDFVTLSVSHNMSFQSVTFFIVPTQTK